MTGVKCSTPAKIDTVGGVDVTVVSMLMPNHTTVCNVTAVSHAESAIEPTLQPNLHGNESQPNINGRAK